MEVRQIFAIVIALTMVVSGLGILSTAANTQDNEIASEQPISGEAWSLTTGGQRWTHFEDFTEIDCPPCASHNPGWTAAIETMGYTMASPAYVHVWWPAPNDNDEFFLEANNGVSGTNGPVDQRVAQYGFGGVPNAWVDGTNVATHQGQAAYELLINDRVCVPSRVKIETTGSTIGGGAGTVNARVTCVEDLPAGDWRIVVFLWENNVTHVTPGTNGETEFDWGVWEILPDNQGTAVWAAGASKGDFVDISEPFTMDPSWIESEMGATVILQNYNDNLVENSRVTLFDGFVPPAQDMVIYGKSIEIVDTPPRPWVFTTLDAGKPYNLDCVVYNSGDTDENNVQVHVTLDSVHQMTEIVPTIPSDGSAYVSFSNYIAPSAGVYQFGFEVDAVAGETRLFNNVWERTCTVTNEPDVWYTPPSFDFTVPPDSADSDTLTVGNDGLANLDWDIAVGLLEETFGSWDAGVWNGNARDRGNIYLATTDSIIWEHQFYLNIAITTELYFVVYEGAALTGLYNQISSVYVASSGTGEGFYSSGPINVPMTAGMYYYLGCSWSGFADYGRGTDAVPIPTTFGTLETGSPDILAGFPPAATCNNANTGFTPYYQKVTAGPGTPTWLTVNPLTGTTLPSSTSPVTLDVDTTGLLVGFSDSVMLYLTGNDRDEPMYAIPVNLNVDYLLEVNLTAPDPVTADQIISGDYLIEWEAIDATDPPETLWIDLDYSPDGGSTWIPIDSGLFNTVAGTGSYLWDTTTASDGVNILVRVNATNSLPYTNSDQSVEALSIDNVVDDQWFFQIEVTGPDEDLDMKPVEGSANTITSAALTSAVDYQIGKWETTKTFTGKSIDGLWEFNVYGYTVDPGTLVAYLYAKVTDGTGAVIDQTASFVAENVGAYTTRNLFTWSETLAGIIPDGQSVIVELWLDVQTPSGGGTDTLTYVPNDTDFHATYWDVDTMPPEGANLNVPERGITPGDVSASDDTRFNTISPGNFDEIFVWCEVNVTPTPSTIIELEMTFEGQSVAEASNFNLWALSTSGWAATGDTIAVAATTDGTLKGSITVNCEDYVIGGVFTWGVYQTTDNRQVGIDFLRTNITYIVPDPLFTMEYDFGDTQSNVKPTISAGGPNTFDIPMTVPLDGSGWQFVSFSIDVAGSDVLTIFDDEGWGGEAAIDAVKWDMIYWYDPTDATDPWKSYNKNWGGTQDMPGTVTNHMGFWLHITDNPGTGDSILTVGDGADPVGESVTLEAGWNLVGFPTTATDVQAQNTLPNWGVSVTKIGYYNDPSPYDIIETADGTTLMNPGNAYWVYSTIQQPWNL